MRWSLILSGLIAVQSALSFVCVALAIPPQSDELERRADPLRLSAKKYRENSKWHDQAYHVEGLGPKGKLRKGATVTQTDLKTKKEKYEHSSKLLPTHQADHVFEVQMLKHHLKEHKINDLKPGSALHNKITNILNGPKNMALIPGSINGSKGQLIKHGMNGKKIKPQKARDEYAKLSYPTAQKTARRLDKALKAHPGYSQKVGGNTLEKKLHNTFVAAGLHPSSRSSSPHSGSSSGHSNSRHSSPGPGPSTPPPRKSKQTPSSPSRRSRRNAKKAGRQ